MSSIAFAKSVAARRAGKSPDQILIIKRLAGGESLTIDEDGYMHLEPSHREIFADYDDVRVLEEIGSIHWIDGVGFKIADAPAVANGEQADG